MTYLKCEYSDGMFSDEYAIKFEVVKPMSQNSCFVNKEDVIPLEGNYGLVKLISINESEKDSIVCINNVGEHRISNFKVYNVELVDNI
jgi:hypothetical protein